MTQPSYNQFNHSTLFLQRRVKKLANLAKEIQKKLDIISLFRIAAFLTFAGGSFAYYILNVENRIFLIPILLIFLLFLGLVFYYQKTRTFKLRLISYESFLNREILRSEFKLDTLYDYDISINKLNLKNHFHLDLGISGKNGLFTYLNTTKTQGGEKLFLENLLQLNKESLEKILERQNLIKEFCSFKYPCNKILRILEEAQLEDESGKINLKPLFQNKANFFENKKVLKFFFRPFIIIGWLLCICLFLLDLPSLLFSLFFINTILFIINRKEIILIFESFKKIQNQIPSIRNAASYLSGLKIKSNPNFSIEFEKNEISKMFNSLDKIITRISIQNAPLMHYLLNMLVLWDLWQLTALANWQNKYIEVIKKISENLETVDSVLPFVNFKFHNQNYQFPSINPKIQSFSSMNLGHPMIPPKKRVLNPLKKLKSGESLIITGSNMSGKTTYLRTVGLNILLGLCGSVVAADKMEFPPMKILTSIKNEDSLEEGISFFYAEVKRISYILNETKEEGKFIILLDELLKGTNTRERLIASKAIIQKLMKSNSFVFITTHDVELAVKAENQKLAHFTEMVKGNRMSFDYKIKDGVIKSTNALKILEIENLDLDLK